MELPSPFPFDPSYGYDRESLLRVPAPEGPADFADFWRETYREARAVPLRLERKPLISPDAGFLLWDVRFDAWGDCRIGGWLSVPASGAVGKGIVLGHGYGGRDTPGFIPGAATLSPCARGFHLSARADLPDTSARHVLHGIERRETYLHRGCAADLWAAATALLELHPEVEGRLSYRGGSFGGGIGALAIPWDGRFSRAFLDIPSFGNHPLRVQLPCQGSGEAVRLYHHDHPEVLEVLAYHDAATAARYFRIPVTVAPALYDPAVPPPGQFAIYNGIPDGKELIVRTEAHLGSPTELREAVGIEDRLNAS